MRLPGRCAATLTRLAGRLALPGLWVKRAPIGCVRHPTCLAATEQVQDSLKLFCGALHSTLGPHHEIRLLELAFDGPLGADAPPGVLRRPTPAGQTLGLTLRGTSDADGGGELGLRRGFEQERDHHHAGTNRHRGASQPGSSNLPRLGLRVPAGTDARVQNLLELPTTVVLGKDNPSQRVATQMSVLTNDPGSEAPPDFLERWLSRQDQLPREQVGVHHGETGPAEEISRGRLAHTDAASQAEQREGGRRGGRRVHGPTAR